MRRVPSNVLLARYRKAALSKNPWPKMAAICLELLRRGDKDVALEALSDESPTVREWAAVMALEFAPAEAERTLEELVRHGLGTAKIVLHQWRGGLHRTLTMTDAEWVKRLTEFHRQGRPGPDLRRAPPASIPTRSPPRPDARSLPGGMTIADITLAEVFEGKNWMLAPDEDGDDMPSWHIRDAEQFAESDTVVYSALAVSSDGRAMPLVVVREVGTYDWWGDTCAMVRGVWRPLGELPPRSSDHTEDYVANPLPNDPSFGGGDSHADHRAGFLRWRSKLLGEN